MMDESKILVVQRVEKKNMIAALVLALFLGPIGLLYASVTGGIIMLAINAITLILSIVTFGLLTPIFGLSWLTCLVWAALAVDRKNKIT
jgi:hypothetical protein